MEKTVTFSNAKDDIQLAGTLTLPANPVAGVVLVSGSGPQGRDQLFMGHKTFWVLADYLSRHGIAVLRYDDRGVGESSGVFDRATSYDFANDASAAIDYLAEQSSLAKRKIGIVGHSEGGLIAPVVARQNALVDFIILLAGPSKNGRFIAENQMQKILLSNGVSLSTAKEGSDITKALNNVVLNNMSLSAAELSVKLTECYADQSQQLSQSAQSELKRLGGGSLPEHRIKLLTSPWYKTFITHEPTDYLTALSIPVLALFGEKDVQVSATDHFPSMKVAINRNNQSQAQILSGHNHMFQRSKTGAMSEYQHIEETLSPLVLTTIDKWIHGLK